MCAVQGCCALVGAGEDRKVKRTKIVCGPGLLCPCWGRRGKGKTKNKTSQNCFRGPGSYVLLGPARQRKNKTKPKEIKKSQNEPTGQDQRQNARLRSARANIGVRSRANKMARRDRTQTDHTSCTQHFYPSIHSIHLHRCSPILLLSQNIIYF